MTIQVLRSSLGLPMQRIHLWFLARQVDRKVLVTCLSLKALMH